MDDRTRILEARDVHKTYRFGAVPVEVLRGADLTVHAGEWVAILGSSGSGKSTLLHLLGGLDRPDRGRGEILWRGESISIAPGRRIDRYRNREVGFVFQFYHLLPELDTIDNVMLPAMVGRLTRPDPAPARAMLESFGLGHRLHHRPAQLSGGERQRAAIARALVRNPGVLLADEPTGNLDAVTGAAILDLLAERHKAGLTIVMVTHDAQVAARADRIVHLRDGCVQA
jgi:ABC-type lipoprotein export system ATPase subunit